MVNHFWSLLAAVLFVTGCAVGLAVSAPLPKASAQAQAEPGKAGDLQKQIDDALKELDKLEQVNPNQPEQGKRQLEDVRRQMRQQLLQGLGQPGAMPMIGFGGRLGQGSGRLGASLQRPMPALVDQLKLDESKGLLVLEVFPESAAAKAGFKKHDIVLEIDGKPVSSDPQVFVRNVREMKADQEMSVKVLRQGQMETLKGLKLPEAKAEAINPFQGGFVPGPIQNIQIPNIQIQQIPNIQIPNIQILPGGNVQILPGGNVQIPGFPGAGAGGVIKLQVNANAGGGANEAMKVQVVNDDFTIELTSGAMKAVVKGKRENGTMTPNDIQIQDDGAEVRANSVARLPERYRATVNRMLESVR